jgi:hypothetical protein
MPSPIRVRSLPASAFGVRSSMEQQRTLVRLPTGEHAVLTRCARRPAAGCASRLRTRCLDVELPTLDWRANRDRFTEGVSDVRALPPGVYFVRGEGRGAGDVEPIRKVVMTR